MQADMMQPNNYRIDEAKYKSLLKYIRLSVTEKYECHLARIESYTSTQNKASVIATKYFIESLNWQDSLPTKKTTISSFWFCENTLPTKEETLYDGHSTKNKTSDS